MKVSDTDYSDGKLKSPVLERIKNKKLVLIVLLIIVAVVAGILFLLNVYNKTEKDNLHGNQTLLDNPLVLEMVDKMPIPRITMIPLTTTPAELPRPQSTSTTSGIIGLFAPTEPLSVIPEWQTYTNDSLKFSLMYPPSARIEENKLGFGVWDISINSPEENNAGNSFKILAYHKAIGKLIGLSYDDLKKIPVSNTQLITMDEGNAQRFTKISDQAIKGRDSLVFLTSADPPDPNIDEEIVVYIDLAGSTLVISTPVSNKSVLEQMLSSFKSF